MKQKLMLIASGALAALALAALPAVAAAGEFAADCENGAATCAGVFTGGLSEIKNDKGEGSSCSSSSGTATVTNGSSTGAIALTFKGCRENITGFKFSCSNTGVAGEISTGSMVTHLIYLEPNAATPGINVTLPPTGVTFNCAGFAKKTVTGKAIAHLENPNCGTFQASHSATFSQSATGVPTWKQATTSGEATDLITNNDAGGAYTTEAVTSTSTIDWTGTKVRLTC
ncbi:MAG TPA: hypothetical protein VF125_09935 [Solirubrobacterales bacterium]